MTRSTDSTSLSREERHEKLESLLREENDGEIPTTIEGVPVKSDDGSDQIMTARGKFPEAKLIVCIDGSYSVCTLEKCSELKWPILGDHSEFKPKQKSEAYAHLCQEIRNLDTIT